MQDLTARLAALQSEPSRDDPRDPARLARVERTRTEMLAQGGAIAATLWREEAAVAALAERLRTRPITRVVVAGCGDSWFTGMGARLAFEQAIGVPAEGAQALDWAAYGAATADAGTLMLGLSAGGNTPAVMAALRAARARGAFTVGVSNTAGSPVMAEADAGLLVHATRRGWPTQSSTACLALLIRLAAAIGATKGRFDPAPLLAGLDALPALVDEVAAGCDVQAAEIAAEFAPARLVLFAGLGPNLAAAAFGAAKVRELSPVHALATPIEELHHYRAMKRGDPLFLVATDPPSRERALDTTLVGQAVGARVVALLAGPDPEIEARAAHVIRLPPVLPVLSAIPASIPLHLFAYHFARIRAERGLGYPGP